MKRVAGLRIILVLFLSVLVSRAFAGTEAGLVQERQLTGAAAQEFLVREGILDQLSSASNLVPPQDRNFLEPSPLTASDGAANEKFGISVATSGDTVIVGAQWADISGRSAQGAAYVFVRDGDGWTQQQKLVAGDGLAGDNLGRSVAVDNDTAVVGAYLATIGGRENQGAVYVFTRQGNIWSQKQKLVAVDGTAYDQFGNSVALDGNTTVVGAHSAGVDGKDDQGAVYVFSRSGGTWNEQQKLVVDDGAEFDQFGSSVAVDGNTVVVGAFRADIDGKSNQGAAYVFARAGNTWSMQQKLFAADGAESDRFGRSVALAGETAVVGAPLAAIGGASNQGTAYIFTRSNDNWSQQAKVMADDGASGDQLGIAVAVDGDTVIAGAYLADIGGQAAQGAAYIFTRQASNWSQQQKLVYDDGATDNRFGFSVALSEDTAVAGAYLADGDGPANRGIAYITERGPVPWPSSGHNVANDGAADDQFGYSVAVSGDTAVVGAFLADVDGTVDQGAAYVFVRNGPIWVQQQKLVAADGVTNRRFGSSVALFEDTALIGDFLADIDGLAAQGAAYVFRRSGNTWSQKQKLTADDGATADFFGSSVALDEGTVVVGARLADIDGKFDQGAAYVFTRSGDSWSQQQKLVAADGEFGDNFGDAVSLDGGTAVVGAAAANVDGNSDQGAAYLFARDGKLWSEKQKLVASDGAVNDLFANSVAVDRDTVLVGAHFADIDGNLDQGAAYIFRRSGGVWSESQKLVAPDGRPGAAFGISVGLDGNTLLAGAYASNISGVFEQGSAYIFGRSGESWRLEQKLLAADGANNDLFGKSVALSGSTAVVGAFWADVGSSKDQGKVYFFQRRPPSFKVYLPMITQ